MSNKNPLQALMQEQDRHFNSVEQEALTFALIVDGYEADAEKPCVFGRMLLSGNQESGERVRVFLRPDTRQSPTRARPEIMNFNNKNDQVHTAPGGILIAERAYATDAPNTYSAHWLTPASHFHGQAFVRRAFGTFYHNFGTQEAKGGEQAYAAIHYYKAEESVKVETLSQLKDVVAKKLDPPAKNVQQRVLIRIKDSSGTVICVAAAARREKKPGEQYALPVSGRESMEHFFSAQSRKSPDEPSIGESLQSAIEQNLVTYIEVIPGATVYFGPETVQKYVRNTSHADFLYNTTHDGRASLVTEMLIVARQRSDKQSLFLTHAHTVSSKSPAYLLKNIPTPHYTPEQAETMHREAKTENAAAPANAGTRERTVESQQTAPREGGVHERPVQNHAVHSHEPLSGSGPSTVREFNNSQPLGERQLASLPVGHAPPPSLSAHDQMLESMAAEEASKKDQSVLSKEDMDELNKMLPPQL